MSILTQQEMADSLGYTSISEVPPRANLLPSFVDDFIKTATGHDWASDTTIDPTAKMLASALTIRWFEDPGQMGKISDNDIGVKSLIGQLHAKALQLEVTP